MDPHLMWFGRSLARQAGGSGRSGLTGPPDIPEPEEEQPKSLRERYRAVEQAFAGTMMALPRVLRLVWDASPALTIGLGLATVLNGLIPAATAYTAKLLINAVVEAIKVRALHSPDSAVLALGPLRLAPTTSFGVIVELAILQFLIFALTAGMGTVRNIAQQLLQEKVSLTIQLMIMDHASTLDLEFFENSRSYDLLRQAQQEAAMRPVQMISTAFGLGQTAITFISMVALLIGVSPLLALVALVSPIPQFISNTRYGWRGYNLSRWASPLRRRMQYLTTLVTTDTFAKEVKLFGLGGFFLERFRLLSSYYYDRQRRLVTRRYLVGSLWGLITTLAGSVTYLYVAWRAVIGPLTLGDLTLFTQAASSVQNSIQGLLSGFSSMYENNLYLNNLYQLLETEAGIKRPENAVQLPRPVRGEVVFDHVSFQYPGSAAMALDDVSFRIAPGETVAVVGRNGAGKSTLIKLLCRLYDPSGGRILLDGIDIRQLDPGELRGVISAMFQDYVTYQATAAENIGLGDVSEIEDSARVARSAAQAGAAPMIEQLPLGYDTALGKWFDEGVNLSGGEWQKVALSRAFMRDAPLLVLDEPTSALDAQAEYELFARLRRLAEGRTALYISHRFSTVRQADRILFFEHGRLVEEGTHQDLMALAGRYARLFNMQASAYTGEPVEGLDGLEETGSDGVAPAVTVPGGAPSSRS